MRQSKVISICGAFLILSSVVFAGPPMTYMVPGDFSKIQEAIDWANDGDTVVVSPGTYNENIDFGGKNIRVTSMYPEDPAMTVIDAGGSGSVVMFANGEGPGAVLRGFTITGGYGTVDESSSNAVLGAGIYCDNASPTIVGNVITGNNAPTDETTAAGIGCGIFCRASEAVISRNIITENTGYGGGAIAVYVCDVVITNNLICNNEATYIGGVYLAYGGQLVNNTLAGNEASAMGGNVCALGDATAGRFVVKNNIICTAVAGGGIHVEGGPADYEAITYNNVWNNTGGNYEVLPDQTGLNGNISQDPGFGVNYHISAGSPCYDAGDPDFVPWLWQRDIDSEPAVMDARVDIGADEVTGNARPVADAGADQYFDTIPVVVILDGSGSYDPDGGVLTYEWSQTAGPGVTLSNEDTAGPSFVPTEENVYSFELIVNDGTYSSSPDSVIIVVGNRPPVADAGDDQFGEPGETFSLNGLSSYDPDENDVLTYSWSQLSGPVVELTDADSATPWFEPVMEGEYVFELVVSDGTAQSGPDTVTVLVQIGSEPDAYGYRWIDSDSSWGPQYHWIDIRETGTEIEGLHFSFDDYVGPFPLGFDFDFYGTGYQHFYVQTNGIISFSPVAISYDNQPIPASDGYDNLIAWMWTYMYPSGISRIYYQQFGGYTIVQFVDYSIGWGGVVNAEVIMYDSGRILIQYKSFSQDAYLYQYTVGIENSDGTIGTQTAFNDYNYLHDELALEFSLGPPYQPVADAGPDQFLIEIGEVTLDGSGSYDRDPCDVLTYQWSQTVGPEVGLSDATAVQPTFMPEVEGEYMFELVVSDGLLTSYPDEVLIVVGNRAPVADAGSDKICQVDEQVQLDGSDSYDPDHNPLTFIWTQLAGPAVDLQDPCTATPYFDCTEEGVYEFELVVSDGVDDSEASTVQVVVIDFIIDQEILDVGHTHHEPGVDGYHHYPDISGSRIVYSEGEACDFSWLISSEDLEDNNADWLDYWFTWGANAQPKIDGDIVVWFGPGRSWEVPWTHEPSNAGITILNVSTGQKKDLRRYTWSESYSHPAVSGSKVVWLEHLNLDPRPTRSNEANNWWNTPYNICGADITDFDEPEYFTIAENVGSRDPYPCHTYGEDFDDVIDICGDIAVWEGGGDIYGADISDLDNIEVFTICNDPGRQFDPAISGSVVIWTDERNDAGDIYGADISNVEEIEVFEVVKEPGNQQQPAIDKGLIVYVDGGLYGGQIRACYLIRQFHGVFEIPLLGLPYGCGPAIDNGIIIWQSAPYGYAQGMSVEVSYSILDGPVENTTSGKSHDYIQHAINFADYGDVIVAGSGVYHENINFKGKSVVLTSGGPDKSDEAAEAVIQGDGTGSVVTFAGTEDPNCQLIGFTITGGRARISGGGIYGAYTVAAISSCVIKNNRATRHGGGLHSVGGTIEGCTIFENTARNGGGGMAGCHGTISSCLIYNNTAGCNGAMSNCDGDIINCTIVNNTAMFSPGGLGRCDGSINNCIIWGNYYDQLLNCSEPAYSCIEDWTGGGICNINSDPEFVDANSAVPLEGMDAYWMFDRDPNDSSPNGHDGTLFGDADLVPDSSRGQVLMLDGAGDYVEIAGYKGITGKHPRTVSAWIRTDMTTVGEIISWGGTGAGEKWLLMLQASGELRLVVNAGSVNGTTQINDGKWHYVAAVWEDSYGPYTTDIKFYIDGQEEPATGRDRRIDTGSETDVTIGCSPDSDRFFNGLMDEVAIWDRALSGAEISILYERGLCGVGYLRVEGDFHLLAGSPCIDAADNLAVVTSADVDGNTRILDGNNDGEAVVDMGACEFVYPNIRPVADAMDDQTVFAWVDGIAEVTLDGSGSFDADGDELEYFWFEGAEQIATGVDPNVLLGMGEHIIELIVDDGTETSEPNEVVITVIGPIEADVHIVPRTINRRNRTKRIMAIVRLPEGIAKIDIADEPFVLEPGGIEAIWDRVIGRGNQATVFALFNKDKVMAELPNTGRVELTVVGKLESGQCIYGTNTVRIVRPRRRRVRGLRL